MTSDSSASIICGCGWSARIDLLDNAGPVRREWLTQQYVEHTTHGCPYLQAPHAIDADQPKPPPPHTTTIDTDPLWQAQEGHR